MTSSISSITIDCRDPYLLARFWAGVLGYIDDPGNPNAPDDPEAVLIDPRRRHPDLLFVPVPEHKAVKNRVHLDLRPAQLRELEVDRVLALGASLVADHRRDDGTGWAVLADPEGNEFCVERSAAERPEPAPVDTGMRRFPTVRTSHDRDQIESLLDWYRAGVERKVAGGAAPGVGHAVALGHLGGGPGQAPGPGGGLVVLGALRRQPPARLVRRRGLGRRPGLGVPHRTRGTAGPVARPLPRRLRPVPSVAAAHEVDDRAAADEGRPFNLGFILVHLLEETARHLGHLDVLRELLDGTTGE